jgi:hypothetical protein
MSNTTYGNNRIKHVERDCHISILTSMSRSRNSLHTSFHFFFQESSGTLMLSSYPRGRLIFISWTVKMSWVGLIQLLYEYSILLHVEQKRYEPSCVFFCSILTNSETWLKLKHRYLERKQA